MPTSISNGESGSSARTKLNTLFSNEEAHEANISNPHNVTKTQVGLSNVDNTSDANKPVSNAQATAISVVQSDIDTHEALTNNPHSVTKSQVGLSNVDNTSDANKPVSTAQQAALNALLGIMMQTATGVIAPADATTYYSGVVVGNAVTAAGSVALVFPKDGTIKRIDVIFTNQGTMGTAETSEVKFRLNNTTDTSLTSAVTNNSARSSYSATGLSIAVSAGDTGEGKWLTPTWVTNPTNVRFYLSIYIE